MDISKVRPDRIHEEKISDKKSLNKTGDASKVDKTADLFSAEQSEKTSSASNEKINWSADAQLATEGLAQAKAAPDTRQDKVAMLKDAIRRGTYQPNAKGIAEKMIQSSLEEGLLTRKS